MPFYKLDEQSSLKDYYRVFATVWPFLSIVPFFVLLELVLHVSRGTFWSLYLSCTGIAIVSGAPLFHWSHRRSDFAKDPRPVSLATGLTVLLSSAPLFYYFLSRTPGLEILPAVGALCVVIVPWIALCVKPPTKLYERLRARRTDKHSC